MIAIIFLSFKLGQGKNDQKQQVMIEFNEVVKPEETKPDPVKAKEQEALEAKSMPSLSSGEMHSIASNVASKLEEKISTEQYEKEVMHELGMTSMKPTPVETPAQAPADENAIGDKTADKTHPVNPGHVPNVIRKDNTTVSYLLNNRWHSYLYIPTYKCEGGGTVYLDIIVNQEGRVTSAIIAENKSTPDDCLRQEAYHSAITAQFDPDPKAPPKQVGTITYVFISQ
jgi:TonB family protein